MQLRIVGMFMSALLLPSLSAAEFVYTGLDVSYVDVEFDSGPVNLNGDGYRFSGSMQINDRLFALGRWEEQSYDLGIDGTEYALGIGYRHALSNTLDLIGTASYEHAEVNVAGFGFDDDGLGLGAGLRAQLAAFLQVEASLNYVDLDSSGSDTSVDLLGRYYFTDRFAISLGTTLNSDVDTLSVGFRAEF